MPHLKCIGGFCSDLGKRDVFSVFYTKRDVHPKSIPFVQNTSLFKILPLAKGVPFDNFLQIYKSITNCSLSWDLPYYIFYPGWLHISTLLTIRPLLYLIFLLSDIFMCVQTTYLQYIVNTRYALTLHCT